MEYCPRSNDTHINTLQDRVPLLLSMITWISIKLGSQSCIGMVHSFCAGEKKNDNT